MKTSFILSMATLCAVAAVPVQATNPDTGVPHLYRSSGTTISSPPPGLNSQEGGEGVIPTRLVASPEGGTTVSFRTPSGDLAPHAYLGFEFGLKKAPFVVSVRDGSGVSGT